MAFKVLCVLALLAISQARVLPSGNEPKAPHQEPVPIRNAPHQEPVPIVLPAVYVIDSDSLMRFGEHDNADLDDLSKHARGGIEVGAQRDRWGTNVNVGANGQIWGSDDGRTSVDANGYWNRHYGGPYGTGPSNYGAGISFTHRF